MGGAYLEGGAYWQGSQSNHYGSPIGHVLNEQGTGYEHIFFLVRTFNIA